MRKRIQCSSMIIKLSLIVQVLRFPQWLLNIQDSRR